jgi:hypothetical protein
MNKAYANNLTLLQNVVQELADNLQLKLKLDENTLQVERKKRKVLFRAAIQRIMVLQVIEDCQKKNAVLLAIHVPVPQAKVLIEAGVNFIDTCGNCFLTGDRLRVMVIGNKAKKQPIEEKALGRAFEKEGLKVTFAVLLNADRIGGMTVRDLRDLTGVGIGTAQYALQDLKQRRYLGEIDGKKVLRRKKELLMEWAKAYRVKLRPKLMQGIYIPRRDIMKVDLDETDEVVWGCEMAANKLGAGLWPGFWTIYIWGDPGRAIVKGQLKKGQMPDVPGRQAVELLDLWFKPEGITVPPLLAYADLITSGNARNLEAAHELEEKYNLFPKEKYA